MKAQCELKAEGQPYPRTCPKCGLGPCRKHAPEPLSDEDKRLLMECASTLSDARRLWPARHPAAGMIVGVEDDSKAVYERLSQTLEKVTARLSHQNKGASER